MDRETLIRRIAYQFSMSEPPGNQRPGNIKEVDSTIGKFL